MGQRQHGSQRWMPHCGSKNLSLFKRCRFFGCFQILVQPVTYEAFIKAATRRLSTLFYLLHINDQFFFFKCDWWHNKVWLASSTCREEALAPPIGRYVNLMRQFSELLNRKMGFLVQTESAKFQTEMHKCLFTCSFWAKSQRADLPRQANFSWGRFKTANLSGCVTSNEPQQNNE